MDGVAQFEASSSSDAPVRVGGIHLSGSAAPKTALVVIASRLRRPGDGVHGASAALPIDEQKRVFSQPVVHVSKVYEKIAPLGRMFSDEHLAHLLVRENLTEVFVDCPLGLPPCVRCTLPSCPGTAHCEVPSVAFMQALDVRRGRSKKMLNPQSQRVWDIWHQDEPEKRPEPSYSANMAPLVARAKTLQRRLNAVVSEQKILLKETSVPYALHSFAQAFAERGEFVLGDEAPRLYRNFERGVEYRRRFLMALRRQGILLDAPNPSASDAESMSVIIHSLEVFQAFVTAVVAAYFAHRRTDGPPNEFLEAEISEEGWVYRPEV